MNKVETKKIMAILWAAYPGFYAKAGDMDKDAEIVAGMLRGGAL